MDGKREGEWEKVGARSGEGGDGKVKALATEQVDQPHLVQYPVPAQ
jgi:hypothetical protein